ncbi:MAG TPA: aminomethyl-transferring glycine dehydrogenase subunit GcvPA [bacterium]|nr:aminomethyl-transferring glycine dehydrogenase subunit GcvPA [bacterium]
MRYLPHTDQEIREMLKTIGVADVNGLFSSVPDSLVFKRPLDIPPALSEIHLRNHLRDLSRRNAHGEEWSLFLGGGCYSHYIPSSVSYLISRGEFLTAYTPYQPEVSQGTLQAIFEYQTMMAEILGLEVANASQYDGSTASAEAIRLAVAVKKRRKALVARSLHPEYRQVILTYLKNEGVSVEEIPFTPEGALDRPALKKALDRETACVVAGYPNFFGVVEDLSDVAEAAHAAGALLITSTPEPLALGIFRSPGEMGADIAVAEGQSFGNAMSFGGPGLGVFACRKEYVRSMPGRLVGETVDAEGQRGFVLTLATREQHIRREKATSNICTNVALCALAATITLALWGKQGFKELARMNFDRSQDLKERLAALPGLRIAFSGTTFNEFVVLPRQKPTDVVAKLVDDKILAGIPLWRWYPELAEGFLVCATEMNTDEQIDRFVAALRRLP